MPQEDISLKDIFSMVERGDSLALSDIISKSKDKWNELMKESHRLKKKIELKNIILEGKDLKGVDLSDVLIEDSDFEGSDLSDADLSNSVIMNSNFSGVDLSRAKIYSARLSQTDLSQSKLYGARIDKAYFTGSVNLMDVYLGRREETYRTSPEITKQGFRMAEQYEHMDEDDQDPIYKSY